MKPEKVGIFDKTVLFLFKETARKRRLEFIEKEKKQKDQVVFLLLFFFPCQVEDDNSFKSSKKFVFKIVTD